MICTCREFLSFLHSYLLVQPFGLQKYWFSFQPWQYFGPQVPAAHPLCWKKPPEAVKGKLLSQSNFEHPSGTGWSTSPVGLFFLCSLVQAAIARTLERGLAWYSKHTSFWQERHWMWSHVLRQTHWINKDTGVHFKHASPSACMCAV